MVLVPERVKLGATQSERKLQTIRFFTSRGWPIFAGYGIAANVYAECSFNPLVVGDSNTAFGICQWRGSRLKAIMKEFNISTVETLKKVPFEQQLPWIWWEMTKSLPTNSMERNVGRKLSTIKTAYGAGSIVSLEYERPRAKQAEAEARGGLAQRWYDEDSGVKKAS